MKVGLILVFVPQSTALSRVSSGLGHAVAMILCFWRVNLCIPLLSIFANTFHCISTLSSNGKIRENAGKMGEVGPPAARLTLFTYPIRTWSAQWGILPCGASGYRRTGERHE
jgi:hypothetical protein